jgi:hypothetical protein
MDKKQLELKLRNALMKDFDNLYQREFTTNWEFQRVIRRIEINIMELDNTMKLFERSSKSVAVKKELE